MMLDVQNKPDCKDALLQELGYNPYLYTYIYI